MVRNIWKELGIPATRDIGEVRRAYARRLKTIDQRTEQEAFQRLREAYETALDFCQRQEVHELPMMPEQRVAEPVHETTEPSEIGEPSTPPQAVEHDPARERLERQWAIASRFIDDIDAVLRTGDEAAADRFASIAASEEFLDLTVRDAFEWQLVHVLAGLQTLPQALCVRAAEFFNWYDRPDLAQSAAGPVLHSLLGRLELQLQYDKLQKLAAKPPAVDTGKLPDDALAAKLLLSPYSPWLFRKEAMSASLLQEMYKLLIDIDYRAPELISKLDERTVDWWRKTLAKPRITWGLLQLAAVVLGIAGIAGALFAKTHGKWLGLLWASGFVLAVFGWLMLSRYWSGLWRPLYEPRIAKFLSSTVGRVFPRAIRAGLGWMHIVKALVLTPAAVWLWMRIDDDLPAMLGTMTVPLLSVGAAAGIFLVLVAFFSLKGVLSDQAWNGIAASVDSLFRFVFWGAVILFVIVQLWQIAVGVVAMLFVIGFWNTLVGDSNDTRPR